jgi:lipopolysaccharide transport system ATP-binding protein
MNPAISIKNLSKLYRIGPRQRASYRTLREAIVDAAAAPLQRLQELSRRKPPGETDRDQAEPQTFWALRNISFDVQRGQVIGVIGRNGAGKSTLLRILSRITEPTSGRVELRGRVLSLLEIGTGFHHELTGRENIFLNGAILGMTRREMARRFDEIVAFADIGDFLDTPVKRYSSGMHVRLAFAVACHLDPEILVVDEVLAVGDQGFQRKCLGKLNEVSRSGRTVLFVSHSMAPILNLCEKVVVLDRGRMLFAGDCQKGVELYTELNQDCRDHAGAMDLRAHPNRRSGARPILQSVRLFNEDGEAATDVACGHPLTLELEVDPGFGQIELHVAVGFDDNLGTRLFTVGTHLSDSPPLNPAETPCIRCRIDQIPLLPGRYWLTLSAGPIHRPATDAIERALSLEVVETDFFRAGRFPPPNDGKFLVRSHWKPVAATSAGDAMSVMDPLFASRP